MQIINHDIWWQQTTYEGSVVLVTTNGIRNQDGCLVMGKGIALQAKLRYRGIDRKLGGLVKIYGNLPHYLPSNQIISFPTKNHWKDNSDIDLIKKSAKITLDLVNLYEIPQIYLPKVGCGNGNLKWEDVEKVLFFMICLDTVEKIRYILILRTKG